MSVRVDKLASSNALTQNLLDRSEAVLCLVAHQLSGFSCRTSLMGECDWLLIRARSMELQSNPSIPVPSKRGSSMMPERLVYLGSVWWLLRRCAHTTDTEWDKY